MAWIVGIVVVSVALVWLAARRMNKGPSYGDRTQGRIDDHEVRRSGDNLHDRFGGGNL